MLLDWNHFFFSANLTGAAEYTKIVQVVHLYVSLF